MSQGQWVKKFVCYRPQQMSHRHDVYLILFYFVGWVGVKILMQKWSFLLIVNHTAIIVSVKNNPYYHTKLW